jgi:hypothetical protein
VVRGIGIFLFPADNRGKVGGIADVALVGSREFHGAGALGKNPLPFPETPLLRERKRDDGPVERLDVEGAFGAADGEVPSRETLDLESGGAHRGGGFRVFEDGQHVVHERVVGRLEAAARERHDLVRFAEDGNGQVDDVATEFEHGASGEFIEGLAVPRRDHFRHHRMRFEDLAEPSRLQHAVEQLHRGIEAVHEAHLHDESLFVGDLHQFPVFRHRGSGGFVEMDVVSPIDGEPGVAQEIAHLALDPDDLELGRFQAFLQREKRKLPVERTLARGLEQGGILLDDANDLPVPAFGISLEFVGMGVARTDLEVADRLGRSGGPGDAGGGHGQGGGGGEEASSRRHGRIVANPAWQGEDSISPIFPLPILREFAQSACL